MPKTSEASTYFDSSVSIRGSKIGVLKTMVSFLKTNGMNSATLMASKLAFTIYKYLNLTLWTNQIT